MSTVVSRTQVADWWTAYTCLALKFSIYLAGSLVATPIQRIFEADVCRNYYRKTDPSAIDTNDDILEKLCKVSPVQQGVSSINGLQSGISLIPSLLATLLYLALLQRMNKKQMLLLNITGFVLMDAFYSIVLYFYNFFDPRWIVATSMFYFVGGGFPVFNSILPALIAESVPQESLSSFQLYTSAISLLVRTVGSSVSLSMMKSSLWLPVVLGLCIQALLIPMVFICFRSSMFGNRATNVSGMNKEEYVHLAVDDEGIELSSNLSEYNPETSSRTQPRSRAASSSAIWRFIRQHITVLMQCLLPCTVVVTREIGEGIRYVLPYWMSRRYHWELREVGWVRLCETLFAVLVVAALPRFAKKFLQKQPSTSALTDPSMASTAVSESGHEGDRGSHNGNRDDDDENVKSKTRPDDASIQRDLSLAKVCILLTTIGTLLLGLSWYRIGAIVSLAIFAAGTGFQDAYFSYLAGSMPEENKSSLATVYMILSMATLGGFEIGGSIISATYSVVLNWGGESWEMSVPIWFSALFFGISWWIMRRHK